MPAGPIVVVSCSLNPESRSHRLALYTRESLEALEVPVELIDLRECDLPFCDGDSTYHLSQVRDLTEKIASAAGVIVAAPIYNYDLNAAAKNLVELTGSAWQNKPVGFVCAAGGRSSYMSPMGLANSLMFDFRSIVIPRFVYAIGRDFDEHGELSAETRVRVEELAEMIVRLADALAQPAVQTKNAVR